MRIRAARRRSVNVKFNVGMAKIPSTKIALLIGLVAGQVWGADVVLRGRVVDEDGAPVRDAKVEATGVWAGQTDPTGSFTFSLPKEANLFITIEREGYYAIKDQPVHLDNTLEVTFVMNSVHEVFQSENVNAQASPVDVGQTQTEEHLSGTEVNDIPFTNSHSLQNALGMFPERCRIRPARCI